MGVGQQNHPGGAQHIQGMAGLLQRSLHIRQGECCEETESSRVIGRHLGGVLIHLTGPVSGFGIVDQLRPEMHPGCGDRKDPGCDAVLLHQINRCRCRPIRQFRSTGFGDAQRLQPRLVAGWDQMLVNIDALRGHGEGKGTGCREPQKATPEVSASLVWRLFGHSASLSPRICLDADFSGHFSGKRQAGEGLDHPC